MTSKFMIAVEKQSKPLKEEWKPHAYQKVAVKFLLENTCAGLFLCPGLGKTSIVLAALKVLKQKKMFSRALIIAPVRPCYLVWPKEIERWAQFNDFKVVILHGKDKDKEIEKDADLYIMNPEGLPWLLHTKRYRQIGADILIIDESSAFKHTNTQRFKLLKPILQTFQRRWILTGTPAPNGLMDIFGQIFILDLGNALGQYITHFRNRYFSQTGFGGYTWQLQEGAEARIQAAIKPLTLHLSAEDHLDLPEFVSNRIEVELDKPARKMYNEMEKELIIFLKNTEVVASNAAVASMKCAQIANGGLWGDNRTYHHAHNAKADTVKEIVESLQGSPALIGYEFEHDLQRLLKTLGKGGAYIGGGVSMKRSAEIEAEWNKENLPWLLGQPAAMGHGLNLQKAGNHVIWHSIPWNFEHYDQFNKRVRRQGNKHSHVFLHHIVAKDTVDEAKMLALAGKDKTQKSLLNSLKGYLKNKS